MVMHPLDRRAHLTMLSGLLGLAAIAGVPTRTAAQQNDFNHWGYV